MDYETLLKRAPAGPLYARLLSGLESAIEKGSLTVGARLPSERDLADLLSVSRTTVTTAYRELESRGILRSHVGRGTFVVGAPETSEAPFAWRGKVSSSTQRLNDPTFRHLMRDSVNPAFISFALGSPAMECFPADEYRRVADKVLRTDPATVFGLGPTEGQPMLRKALADRQGLSAEEILVVSGSQQGLDLLARCLVDPGDTVIVDRPTYVGAVQTFRSAGANLVGWDIVRGDFEELEDLILRHRPKLLYVNPTFHNPTGHTMPAAARRELLRLAGRYRLPIVEDDPYRELYFDGPAPPSLHQLDEQHLVIYLSTFSKPLAPGLRLGWLAASEAIIDQLATVKQRANSFTEGLGQRVIAEFLQSGFFDAHVEEVRAEHRKRRVALVQALRKEMPAKSLAFTVPEGGMYLWCRLGHGVRGEELLAAAVAEGVIFANGQLFYPDSAGSREIRLCYSNVPVEKIGQGVKRLRTAFEKTRNGRAGLGEGTLPVV